jgi:hypothetical protein
MASLFLPDIAGSFNAGYDRGQNQQFNKLAGAAISDPSTASQNLGLAAAINPGKALAVQHELQTADDAKAKKIGNAANYVLTAYKSGNPQQVQGAYQAVRPFLAQLGQEHGNGMVPPDQFSEDMLPQLYQLVGQAGGAVADPTEGVVVQPGGALVDKVTGKTLYQATDKPPAAIQSMEYLQAHPELAQFQVDQRNAMRPVRAPTSGSSGGVPRPTRAPAGYRWTDNGDLMPIPGGPADKSGRPTASPAVRPPNNEQSNAAGFADRMINAGRELSALEGDGYDPTNLGDRFATGVGGVIGNTLLSDKGQQYRQAAENWVRANLRKESGAAIGKDEMDSEVRNYFPQAGDRPDVVAQKARNRAILEQNMIRTAGPAYHAGGATNSAPAQGNAHRAGDIITVNGSQYRVVGGDPNDPDVEPL